MGAREPVLVGPLRTSVGLADLRFDGDVLRLTVYRGPLDLLDRYRLVLLAVAATVAVSSWYVAAPGRWAVLGLAGILAVVALVAPRRTGSVREWAEPDLLEMDNVHGAWRAHLELRTATEEVRLTGWFWRRRQLDHLQRRLAADDL